MMARALRRTVVGLSALYQRALVVIFAVVGPDRAYAFTRVMASALYALLPPLRERTEAHVAAALGDRLDRAAIRRVAAESFLHRCWNLTDLMLAERWLAGGRLDRYGGRIPAAMREPLLKAQAQRRPRILLTAYYGPYELLPALLGRNGIHVTALYRGHANRQFDTFRTRVRGLGGSVLAPAYEALSRLPRVLDAGGAVALVADHHTARHGLAAEFFGIPTTVSRSVGVLAQRYRADVVIAGVRRVRRRFRFEFVMVETLRHEDWADEERPVEWLTKRYLAAIERLVLGDPTQYAWTRARWGAGQASGGGAADGQ